MVNIPHKIRAAHHFTTSFRYKKRLQAFGNRNNKRSWLQKKHYCSSIFLSCYEKMLYHIIHVERTLNMCLCLYHWVVVSFFNHVIIIFREIFPKYCLSIFRNTFDIIFLNQIVALWYFFVSDILYPDIFLYLTLSWFPKLHK